MCEEIKCDSQCKSESDRSPLSVSPWMGLDHAGRLGLGLGSGVRACDLLEFLGGLS